MTAQGGPRTGIVAAVVGGLLAACGIGGSAAAYVIERGLPDVTPQDTAHRQPRDVCALLGAAELRAETLGEVIGATAYQDSGCDYTLRANSAGASPRTLRLVVTVSPGAAKSFGRAQSDLRRLPVECGEKAFAAHKVEGAGENADAWLWCLSEDVYLTMVFHGYNVNRWNGLELDDTIAQVGQAALRKVPPA